MRQGRQMPLRLRVNPRMHSGSGPCHLPFFTPTWEVETSRCKSRRRCCIRPRRCLQRLRFTNSLAGHCSSHCEYSSARTRHPYACNDTPDVGACASCSRMASDIGSHRRCSTTSRDSRLVIGLERVFAFHGGWARGTPSIRSAAAASTKVCIENTMPAWWGA
jgi:hypothetical protein